MNLLLYVLMILAVANLAAVVLVVVRMGKISRDDHSYRLLDIFTSKLSEEEGKMRTLSEDLAARQRKENAEQALQARHEVGESIRHFQEAFDKVGGKLEQRMADAFHQLEGNLDKNSGKSVEAIKENFQLIRQQQKDLVDTTERKLDEMRATVDEKLQKTLNERIGQSFKIVSEQLENVQRGLGEMQNLAQDVGGLKKVLSNVKVRGTFGEIQLQALLEQMLSPEQYDVNVNTVPSNNDRVEFAVKLPGKDGERSFVYLPIDSKFPKDMYEQYADAVEVADARLVEEKSRQLENAVKKMAKDIHDKYIEVPYTTDFAIMFLPFESIYAEVVRRTALMQELQHSYHIMVTGPTTLGALLNSLQMGFRTLAIQKRTSEVWKTLGAVKTEFTKFSTLIEKAQTKLQQANSTLDELRGTRTNVILRNLKSVESLPTDEAAGMLDDVFNSDGD